MANPEHVEIVKQGADAIAEWRDSNPEVRLDLRGADLEKVDLTSAVLREANLARAELRGAELARVNLNSADLTGASLVEAGIGYANLVNANLTGADLRGASLFSTDLTFAILESADLRGARLEWANLTSITVPDTDLDAAVFAGTVLGDVDFSRARGLEGVEHTAPSVIDERTLRKSWPLPDVFLRGVGLSDQYIEYLPSLMGRAIEFYSCFISYSSQDDEFARRLHADLQDNGVRCWFAPEDLKIGERFRRSIEDAIRLHDKLLLILSEHSVDSTWVDNEVESALEKEEKAKKAGEERTVLFPIRLDSAVEETDAAWAASIRRTRHIGDFSAWKDHDAYKTAFKRLLRDLKDETKEGGNGES